MRPIAYDVQDALREFEKEGLTSTEVAKLLGCDQSPAAGALSNLYIDKMVRREVERSEKGRAIYRYWIIPGAFKPIQLKKNAPRRSPGLTRQGTSHAPGPSMPPRPTTPPSPLGEGFITGREAAYLLSATRSCHEPNHYSAEHLPDGQAVDVDFAYLIHRWYQKGDLDNGRRYEFPHIWLANDRTGVRAAMRFALYGVDDVNPYPIGRRHTVAGLALYERAEAIIQESVDQFMVQFDNEDAWDAIHTLVWRLDDGGLSITQLRPARTPLPREASPF